MVTFPVFLRVTRPPLVTVAIDVLPDVYEKVPFELVVGLFIDKVPLNTKDASVMAKFVIEGVPLLMVKTDVVEPVRKSPDADCVA